MRQKDFILFKSSKVEKVLYTGKKCLNKGCKKEANVLSSDFVRCPHLSMKGLCYWHYNGSKECSECGSFTQYRSPISSRRFCCKKCGGVRKKNVDNACIQCKVSRATVDMKCRQCFKNSTICVVCEKNSASRTRIVTSKDKEHLPYSISIGTKVSVCNKCYMQKMYVCKVHGCYNTLNSDYAMPSNGVCSLHRMELFPDFDTCVDCDKRAFSNKKRCRFHIKNKIIY